MFTKVWHWIAFLVVGPAIAALLMFVSFDTHEHHELLAMVCIFGAAFAMFVLPIICLRGAWSTWKEGWQERVRMNERDRRYGARRGAW